MVDSVPEHLDRPAQSRIGTGGSVMIAIDAIALAHLRVLAAREGLAPEDLASRLVAERLHAMADDIWTAAG